jgi:hypothetical protein
MTTGNWPGPSPPPRPVSPTSTTEWEPRFPWISMVVWPRRRLFYGRRRASTRAPWGDVPLPLPRPLPAVAGVAERPRARCGPAHASGPVRHRGPRPAAPLGRRPRSPAGRLHQPARERPSTGTWPSSPPCSTAAGRGRGRGRHRRGGPRPRRAGAPSRRTCASSATWPSRCSSPYATWSSPTEEEEPRLPP